MIRPGLSASRTPYTQGRSVDSENHAELNNIKFNICLSGQVNDSSKKDFIGEEFIHSALKKVAENKTKDSIVHLIFSGYYHYDYLKDLLPLIAKGMKKYKFKDWIVTTIGMQKLRIITKEQREDYCSGKQSENGSITEDLEILLEDIRLNQQADGSVRTYFLPKLTEKEMKLVERKDPDYLKTFSFKNPDVKKAKSYQMKMSEPNSKFCYTHCYRATLHGGLDYLVPILSNDALQIPPKGPKQLKPFK